MIAVVFPGQGSQTPGMGSELYAEYPEAKSVFDRVSAATSVDIASLCFESDEAVLRQTQNAQLALYTCGLAAWSVFSKDHRSQVGAAAGHSIGEYAALCAAGVFSLEAGAKLVQERGRLMAESGLKQPGTMAAVLGMSREDLDQVVQDSDGIVAVANDNSPGQLIISGEVDAVKRAGELASARGAKRVLPLNVSGAFHSPLMEQASKEMASALAEVTFESPALDVYSNVTSEMVSDPSQWRSLLELQLRNPVRWVESVQNMRRDGVETFVECGVGEVLCGLIRRIDKEAKTAKVFDHASLEAASILCTGKTAS